MDRSNDIEAILFAHGAPIDGARVKKMLDLSDEEFSLSLETLRTRLVYGIRLIEIGEMLQLGTAPETADAVAACIATDEEGELSKPASETLSLILYSHPITKQAIDYVRGVNSVYIIRNLLVRGLIEKTHDSNNKRATLYQPTFDLLSRLEITHVSELPDYEALHAQFQAALQQPDDEVSQ